MVLGVHHSSENHHGRGRSWWPWAGFESELCSLVIIICIEERLV